MDPRPPALLAALLLSAAAAFPADVTVSVDPAADRRAVSPLVFGVNFASRATLGRMGYTANRWGGNSTTRYSWLDDTSNRASDWFFFNIPEDNPSPSALPDGSSADRFVDDTRAAGAEPLLTVPMIGWTPKDRAKRWGYSVAKYGAQQQTECTATGGAFWCEPDAGNGRRAAGGAWTSGNDPTDTSRAIGPSFVTDWMQHLAARAATRGHSGVRFYALDNEPALWNDTHHDVFPSPLTYDQYWSRTQQYAAAIKQKDPTALVFGPADWGWCAYFFSPADNCNVGPDRVAHGNLEFLDWYLKQAKQHYDLTGVRLVDTLDVHYYPQSPGVTLSDDESPATQALRLRSLKSLYDPAYVDESWIGTDRLLGRHRAPHPAPSRLDRGPLPGHPDRDHRVQLGRGRRHEQHARPGRGARHLRPRGRGPRDALGGAGGRQPDRGRLQPLPELRRGRRARPGRQREGLEHQRGPGGGVRDRLALEPPLPPSLQQGHGGADGGGVGRGGSERHVRAVPLHRHDPARERGRDDAGRATS